MITKVAINGFGRIGRIAFRIARDRDDLEIVGINDITDTKTLAYLLAHDTNYGKYHLSVTYDEHNIIIDGKPVPVFAEKDPNALPWKDLDVDVVVESTGRFTTTEGAGGHINAGDGLLFPHRPRATTSKRLSLVLMTMYLKPVAISCLMPPAPQTALRPLWTSSIVNTELKKRCLLLCTATQQAKP